MKIVIWSEMATNGNNKSILDIQLPATILKKFVLSIFILV
jgi:hypothetical protein